MNTNKRDILNPIDEALANLAIKDIFLKSMKCENFKFDIELYPNSDYKVLLKHKVVRSSILESTDHKQHLLRVLLSYGVKWVSKEDPQDELAVIEAEYVAEYKLKQKISDMAIDEFCLKNVGHNVWPYWREFVASTAQRLNLPTLTLPLQKPVKKNHDKI